MTSAQDQPSPVEAWFGEGFGLLHPRLQDLHRNGGRLTGPVEIRFGSGFAGVIGRRIASQMGIPIDAAETTLVVDIGHDHQGLKWHRQFGTRHRMFSTFSPHGKWPDGYWAEHSGKVHVELGVDIINGAWHWRHRKTRLGPLPVPLKLFPITTASKSIEAERYRFSVSVQWFGIDLVSYAGHLQLESQRSRSAS